MLIEMRDLMRKYIYIGLFGFLGAIARYFFKTQHFSFYNGNIPINTLIINLLGAFLISAFLSYAYKVNLNDELRLGIATGFLGTFTTFSTMCKELVNLLLKGETSAAAFYLLYSILIGLLMIYLGKLFSEKLTDKVLVEDFE